MRIVGHEEIVLVAFSCIDVAIHHEEAGVFKVHVGIYIDKRIASELHPAGLVLLNGKLVYLRTEVRSLVFCEVEGIGTQFHRQFVHDFELQIQVCVDVQCG